MKSFTIIELVIAILVIGIIGITVTPKLLDIVREAKVKNEASAVGNVRTGIDIVHHDNYTRGVTPLYPAHLDSANTAPASSSNPIFGDVLQLLHDECDVPGKVHPALPEMTAWPASVIP